ncbi:MAG TPA: SEFIR domain-containing protein [Elusimicrobiales bacterium]|nr:SEFIR domain-containing protein [Elusimicrobiales bacterium]
MSDVSPKVFISYSWTSEAHRDHIRLYAERLRGDGVDVILDQWDLSEGQDKNVFMETMVTDISITHVIIFSDKTYSQKADKRKAGVGTESQIISKKIYEEIGQKKFIPVVCQKQDNDEPFLPTFLESRIWIDFSTQEKVNNNWERLLRALYGKPIYEKPALGKPPTYLMSGEEHTALPTIGKYNSLKDALFNSKANTIFCRKDFLDAVLMYAKHLRIRENPGSNIEDRIIGDIHKLLPLRNQLIDWLLLETSFPETKKFGEILFNFLERILALKYRDAELTSWKNTWFEAHAIFAYELFLYVIAVLIKTDSTTIIHELFIGHYFLPDSVANSNSDFTIFSSFYSYSSILEKRNKKLNTR